MLDLSYCKHGPKKPELIERIHDVYASVARDTACEIQVSSDPSTCARTDIAYYKDNLVVYTEADNPLRVKGFFINNMSGRTIRKPIKYSDHAHERTLTRAIPKRDVERCVRYGVKVKQYKRKDNRVFFDEIYLLDDLCVIVNVTKRRYLVLTLYRITPAYDRDILRAIKRELENVPGVSLMIYDNTSYLGDPIYKRITSQRLTVSILDHLLSGAQPDYMGEERREKLKDELDTIRVDHQRTINRMCLMALYNSVVYSPDPQFKCTEFDHMVIEPRRDYVLMIQCEDLTDDIRSRIQDGVGLDLSRAAVNTLNDVVTISFLLNELDGVAATWSLPQDYRHMKKAASR